MEFGYSGYYIIGEIITCWGAFLICVNTILSYALYDRRQRFFLYAAASTFLASLFNIISAYNIEHYTEHSHFICMFITSIYFFFLLVCPFIMTSYVCDMALQSKKKKKVFNIILGIVQSLYFIFVIINTKTGWIFSFDDKLGYIRGPAKNITYILSMAYGLTIVGTVIIQRRFLARRIFWVFIIYPFISIYFVAIQFFFPKILLTGVASFTSILFAYMTIQSYTMEINLKTGLMTESRLRRRIAMQRHDGVLFVMTIDNINMIQSCLDVLELNQMYLHLGEIFMANFPRNGYILTMNRLAAIGRNMAEVQQKSKKVLSDIKKLSTDINSVIPIPIESYSSAIQFSKDSKDYDSMMDLINSMLVKAKASQLKNLQICDESVFVDRERKRYIYRILKRELNLESQQFQVWYQPIYSISGKQFEYMEALSRLRGTELGDIPPQEFVQVAENRGLIEMLGFVSFEKVCKFISDNRDTVKAVSINFSVYQMMNPKVVDNVLDTIKRFSLSPSNIVMEITESIFIDNYELVMKHMLELAQAGVKFYLDDFGTGYSNLTNVISLPFSTIKMDRSLVLAMEEGQKGVSLFFDLVSTFKGVGFKILVEGVETNNQNYLVERAGVDYIQGFLYSRPLPPDECVELLKRTVNGGFAPSGAKKTRSSASAKK